MNVGRNEPCPCGSGKKYKYCCIDKYDFKNRVIQSHWTKEEVESYSTGKIIFKLRSYGVEITYDSFKTEIKKFYSAQDLSEYWFDKYNVNTTGFDDDFIWLAAWVLWERIPSKIKCDEQISDMIIKGYNLLSDDKLFKSCNIWLEAWDELKKHFKDDNINSLKKADDIYKGDQYLSNWFQYLDMNLSNAGLRKKEYFKERIKFTEEFCNLLPETKEKIIKDMKRAEAESFFAVDKPVKGEKKFKKIISKYPNWIWGYIGWGDMYGPYRINKDIPFDYKKAKRIYEMILETDINDEEKLEILDERISNLEK